MPVSMLEKSSRRPQPGRSCLKVDGNVPRQVQVRFDKVVKVKHHSVPNDVRMIPSKWRSKRTDKVRVAWAWSRSFRAKTWKDNAVALCSACVLETEVMNELGVVCRCPARWPIVWHNSGAYIFTPSPDDPTSLRKCSPVKHSLIDAVALVCRRAKSFIHLGLVPVNVIGDRVFWKNGAFIDREPVQIAAPASVPVEKSVEVVPSEASVQHDGETCCPNHEPVEPATQSIAGSLDAADDYVDRMNSLFFSEEERVSVEEAAKVVAAAANIPVSSVAKWVIDTGCGVDLVDERDALEFKKFMVKSDSPQGFSTANGSTSAEYQVPLKLKELGERICPFVLKNTVNVLSLGRRCRKLGYSFWWPAYSDHPELITPDGRVFVLACDRDVPYLIAGTSPSRSAVPAQSISLIGDAGSEGGSSEAGSAFEGAENGGELEEISDRGRTEEQLRAEAVSIDHLMTHWPKNRFCQACMRSRLRRKAARSNKHRDDVRECEPVFCDLVTMDHVYAHKQDMIGFDGNKDAMIIADIGTGKFDCYPLKSKDADDAHWAIQNFRGKNYINMVYSDNSREIQKAVSSLGFPHRLSTPGVPATNSYVEGLVGKVMAGGRTLLEAAGLPACYWPYAVRAFCFGCVVRVENKESIYNLQLGKGHFPGLRFPFGCKVDFKPSPLSREKQSASEPDTKVGVFFGYELDPGGKWSGRYYVVSLTSFVGVPLIRSLSGTKARVHVQKVREILPIKGGFEYPLKEKYDQTNRTLEGLEEAERQVGTDMVKRIDRRAPTLQEGSKIEGRTGAVEVDVRVGKLKEPVAPPEPEKVIEGGKKSGMDGSAGLPSAASRSPLPGVTGGSSASGSAGLPSAVQNPGGSGSGSAGLPSAVLPPPLPPPPYISDDVGGGETSTPGPVKKLPYDMYVFKGRDKQGYAVDERGQRIRKDIWRPPCFDSLTWSSLTPKVQRDEYEKWRIETLAKGIELPKYEDLDRRRVVASCVDNDSDSNGEGVPDVVCQLEPDEEPYPAMPVVPLQPSIHRDHIPSFPSGLDLTCAVARPVNWAEREAQPAARAACDKEWDKLRNARPMDGKPGEVGCWREDLVEEHDVVKKRANENGEEVHFGNLLELCFEKNPEIPELAQYKGRVVFRGDDVRDQNNDVAFFSEMASSPATMEASKMGDMYGLLPGHHMQMADAKSAYTQARLRGNKTYIHLPYHMWPQKWKDAGMRRPVCPLVLALYGHPQSGCFWEQHCDERVKSIGFIQAAEEWPSCYYHPEHKLLLVIYVDDFKLAGPKDKLKLGWDLVKSVIDLDEPHDPDLYLGCVHKFHSMRVDDVDYNVVEYDHENFLKSCVDLYLQLAPKGTKLKTAWTPFVEEQLKKGPRVPPGDGPWLECPWCRSRCPTESFRPGKGTSFLPGVDPGYAPKQEPAARGALSDKASKILMKVFYAARYSRWDLMRAIGHLATKITCWDLDCDRLLHRLMCYVNTTLQYRMYGWVGNKGNDVCLHVYCDADFAGDQEKMKSTTGVHLALQGSHTWFPFAGVSKKHTCQSHSTPEAEFVSAAHGIRQNAIPALCILERLLGRDMTFVLNEDNQAMIRVVETGKNPTMRHIGRTHGVSVAEIHDRHDRGEFSIQFTDSENQAADIYTKAFIDPLKWEHALKLIGVCHRDSIRSVIKDTVNRVETMKHPKPKPEETALPARGVDIGGVPHGGSSSFGAGKGSAGLPSAVHADTVSDVSSPLGQLVSAPAYLIQNEDYWEFTGREWHRIHVRPRDFLFTPEPAFIGMCPRPGELGSARTTFMCGGDGKVHVHKDRWGGPTDGSSPWLHSGWTGKTVFHLADPTGVPEGLEAMEVSKLIVKDIVKLVKQDKWNPQSRAAVHGEGKCLGVTYERSNPRVNVMSRIQRKIVALVNETLWHTMAQQDFEWTSLQINVNSVSDWHEDSNNVGPSAIMLLGDFDGGHFVHGNGYVNTTGIWHPFDGSVSHSSAEFDGYRVSIVAFQHSRAYLLDADSKARLRGLGFRSRMLTKHPGQEHHGNDGGSAGLPSAAPATMSAPRLKAKRLIVELCTSDSSRIGARTLHSKDCEVVRVTIKDDLTTERGVRKALDAIREFPGYDILVWVSIPCTGGSPWQRINVAKSERARRLVEQHYALFRVLWKNSMRVVHEVVRKGGYVAIEWPKSCAYWREPEVCEAINSLGLQSVNFDGCMFGLVSQFGSNAGEFIRKPWRVDTNSPCIWQQLQRPCDGSHTHVPCAGSDTKATEGYTDELVSTVHDAFRSQCALRAATQTSQ